MVDEVETATTKHALHLELDRAAAMLRRHGYTVTAPPFQDVPVAAIEAGQEWYRHDKPGYSRTVLDVRDSLSWRAAKVQRVTWKTRISKYVTQGTDTEFLRWAKKTGARPSASSGIDV